MNLAAFAGGMWPSATLVISACLIWWITKWAIIHFVHFRHDLNYASNVTFYILSIFYQEMEVGCAKCPLIQRKI